MGNYRIVIEGTGCHHNKDNPGDADRRARQLTEQLIRDNHDITTARFSVLNGDGTESKGEHLLPEAPPCPCCKTDERVTISPSGSRNRGAWFCPCNEPGENSSGHFDIVPAPVAETKRARQLIKELTEELNCSARKSRSRSLAITKLEEASMWLGKDLQELNEPYPYPNSHNPNNPVIDPTAPEACALPK